MEAVKELQQECEQQNDKMRLLLAQGRQLSCRLTALLQARCKIDPTPTPLDRKRKRDGLEQPTKIALADLIRSRKRSNFSGQEPEFQRTIDCLHDHKEIDCTLACLAQPKDYVTRARCVSSQIGWQLVEASVPGRYFFLPPLEDHVYVWPQ